MKFKYSKLIVLWLCSCLGVLTLQAQLPNPILFCTATPQPNDFLTNMSTFGNQRGHVYAQPRGGDLWILYPDGTTKNLTQLAGYGNAGDAFGDALQQGATAIAVRDPHVHWDGDKALFSMVIGHAVQQYQWQSYYWQLYEITGLGQGDTPVITKVANQPENYNNIYPIYGTDDRIIFVSDRPRNGQRHLYPQHDEYESSPTNTGIWRLDPFACGRDALDLLTHSPSGDFSPMIDSYGRLVFTRWDHLQRDQQADGDEFSGAGYGTFTYSDECADASSSLTNPEVFPEPRPYRTDLLQPHENGLRINVFQPWQLMEDGTELETLNHIGRHELASYFEPSFNNDPNLDYHYSAFASNTNDVTNLFQMVEDPTMPGMYYGINAPEFQTHASGQIVRMYVPPTLAADAVTIEDITHPETAAPGSPSPDHSGFYRNLIVLSDGTLLAMHATTTLADQNIGVAPYVSSHYDFKLKVLHEVNGYYVPDTALITAGFNKAVSWYTPDFEQKYDGPLWETFPVEVRVRTRPNTTSSSVPTIEQNIFAAENVDLAAFEDFLKKNKLALIVSHNVTSRDDADRQQPFNLRVDGTTTMTESTTYPGNIYDIKYLQIFQGDQIRGIGGMSSPNDGRRVIAQELHEPTALTYNLPSAGPTGSVTIANDGSMAALVPADRALTWQLTDPAGAAVVRERVWLSFAAGEVRVCASCHGENSINQAGLPAPMNSPDALSDLLQHLKTVDTDGDGIMDLDDAYPNDAALYADIPLTFKENFEGNTEDWHIINADADGVAWKTASNNVCNESVMVCNNRFEDNNGTTDELVHTLDLSNFGSTQLTFDVAYARYDATLFDGLRVNITTCNGTTSTTVYDKSGSTLATAPDNTSGSFAPANCTEWRTETVDLSAFDGEIIDLEFQNLGGWGNPIYLDNITVESLVTPPVIVQVKAWLEGTYDAAAGEMVVTTDFQNLIPTAQPFNRIPWNYTGTENLNPLPTDAIDWVLIEVRDGVDNATILETRAGILLANGEVMDADGMTMGVKFYNLTHNEDYSISIKTRHHLAVLSANAVTLPNIQSPYDFTDMANVMGSSQLMPLNGGATYGLRAGDFNSDGVISVSDFNAYSAEASTINQYVDSDVNLDRSVTVADFNLYLPNSSVIGVMQIRY